MSFVSCDCAKGGRGWLAVAAASAALLPAPAMAQASSPADVDTRPAADVRARAERPAAPSDLSVSLGGAAWHGDFGAPTDTNIESLLVGVRYRTGDLRLSATIPYMRIRSNGTFLAGLGGTPLFVAPNIRSVDRTRDGFGDVTLGASYLLPRPGVGGVDVELNGRIKLPTASDESQLSTGKVDYSIGAEVSKPIGRLTPAVSATYRIFGDTRPWNFNNGLYATAGATYALTNRTAVVFTYEFTERTTRFIGDAHELVLGGSTPLNDRLRLTAYTSAGLSRGASDVSAGLSVSFAL